MFNKKTDMHPATETKELARESTSVATTKEIPADTSNLSALTATQEADSEPEIATGELSVQRNIEEITTEIIRHKSQIVQSFLEIGRLLIEAKEQLANGHGHWLKWLSTSVDISERMAQRYMQLAVEYANTTSVTDLGMTKALALLALPEADRKTFINESHVINGKEKKIDEMSTREIKYAIREKKAASEKPQDGVYKKIWRDDNKTIGPDMKQEADTSTESSSSLNNFAHQLESAQSHLDYIVDFLAKQAENPALLDQYADELRSLYKKTSECITLAKLEVS